MIVASLFLSQLFSCFPSILLPFQPRRRQALFFAVVRCLACSSGAFVLGGKHLTWLKAALVRCMGRVAPEGKAAN